MAGQHVADRLCDGRGAEGDTKESGRAYGFFPLGSGETEMLGWEGIAASSLLDPLVWMWRETKEDGESHGSGEMETSVSLRGRDASSPAIALAGSCSPHFCC